MSATLFRYSTFFPDYSQIVLNSPHSLLLSKLFQHDWHNPTGDTQSPRLALQESVSQPSRQTRPNAKLDGRLHSFATKTPAISTWMVEEACVKNQVMTRQTALDRPSTTTKILLPTCAHTEQTGCPIFHPIKNSHMLLSWTMLSLLHTLLLCYHVQAQTVSYSCIYSIVSMCIYLFIMHTTVLWSVCVELALINYSANGILGMVCLSMTGCDNHVLPRQYYVRTHLSSRAQALPQNLMYKPHVEIPQKTKCSEKVSYFVVKRKRWFVAFIVT